MRSKLRCLPCFLILALLPMGASFALAQVPENEMKAALVYNFIQFTQWPDKAMSGTTFNLCAAPDSAIYPALQKLSGRPVLGKEISIVPLHNAGVGDCNVLMVGGEDNKQAAHARKLLASGPVLGITDDPATMSGDVIIVMMVDSNRVVFSINNTKANAAGIFVSSRLLRLARTVQ